MLYNFDQDLTAYKAGDKNSRFYAFFAKRNVTDHKVLPTNDGSTVVGPRGPLEESKTYLVKYPLNSYYIGPLKGQFRQGKGFRTYADSELVYYGDYVDNLKCGKGKLWSRKDKRWIFDGNWARDMKNGYGEMWKNGVTYKGNWVDDKLDGIGRMDWPSGQSYEGQYARDLRNGKGTMTYPNGDQFVGSWKEGRPNGEGHYKWATGEVYHGSWTDGVMDGLGEIDYGIPIKGRGNLKMGSVNELNYHLERKDEWDEGITKSSQMIKSYRESIIPESVKKNLRPEATSSVGAAGFDGKAPPPNINFSYADSRQMGSNTNFGPSNGRYAAPSVDNFGDDRQGLRLVEGSVVIDKNYRNVDGYPTSSYNIGTGVSNRDVYKMLPLGTAVDENTFRQYNQAVQKGYDYRTKLVDASMNFEGRHEVFPQEAEFYQGVNVPRSAGSNGVTYTTTDGTVGYQGADSAVVYSTNNGSGAFQQKLTRDQ